MSGLKKYINPDQATIAKLIKRPEMNTQSLQGIIADVFSAVSAGGDTALLKLTEKYDGVRLEYLSVSMEEINSASSLVESSLKKAIDIAHQNITKFHESQRQESIKLETSRGVYCWQKSVGIDKVGLYIPGGSAPLFSTVLMLAIPAQLAGCQEIILCTPPGRDGQIHPCILYCAQLCGIHKIFKVGGSQAIAAMTYGTKSIPKVHKIFGPGNQYVTAAKQRALAMGTAIDMPAGPSEVLVFADQTAQAEFVASDLLAQAEHGPDSQVVLVTLNDVLGDSVHEEIEKQISQLPRRSIAQEALKNSSMVEFDSTTKAFDFINKYAPEHLIIASDTPEDYLELIRNAGSVFLGNLTPESAGDYASGTNHTLPTNGFAKSYSGVNLDAFTKKITYQHITKEGITALGPAVVEMAVAEQLEAHANAVRLRLAKVSKNV